MEYTASTAVPKTYTQHQVDIAMLQGFDIGTIFMCILIVFFSFIRYY